LEISLQPLERYLSEIGDIHGTGSAVPETSYYPALSTLLNDIGRSLKPKVKCVIHIQNRGAGIPDAGLFADDQLKRNSVRDLRLGALPSRGVVEAKPPAESLSELIRSEQVTRYCQRYGQVLATNLRAFAVVHLTTMGTSMRWNRSNSLTLNPPSGTRRARHSNQRAARWAPISRSSFAEYSSSLQKSPVPKMSPNCWPPTLATHAPELKQRRMERWTRCALFLKKRWRSRSTARKASSFFEVAWFRRSSIGSFPLGYFEAETINTNRKPHSRGAKQLGICTYRFCGSFFTKSRIPGTLKRSG
jgi:hypothetical protein